MEYLENHFCQPECDRIQGYLHHNILNESNSINHDDQEQK